MPGEGATCYYTAIPHALPSRTAAQRDPAFPFRPAERSSPLRHSSSPRFRHAARSRAPRPARCPPADARDDPRRAPRNGRPRRHLRAADARHVHRAAGARALRGNASRRPRPHAGRPRARRLRAHAGGAADPVRLGVRPLGAKAGHRRGARRVRTRQLHRRVGADDRLDDRRPHRAGRRRDLRGGDRAHRRSDARRRAHACDGRDRHDDRRDVRALAGRSARRSPR